MLKPYCTRSPPLAGGRAEGSGEPQGTHAGSRLWEWVCDFVRWSFCLFK